MDLPRFNRPIRPIGGPVARPTTITVSFGNSRWRHGPPGASVVARTRWRRRAYRSLGPWRSHPSEEAMVRRRTGPILIGGILALAMGGCIGEPNESGSPESSSVASDSPTSASTEPTEHVPASAVPQPSETAAPLTLTWEQPEGFDGQPAELILDGETWVAAGWASERGPAAWTSSDAQTWLPADVVDPQPTEQFRGSGLGPTVRLGDSLLSFGTFIGCCDGRGVLGWRSGDGTSWEVIESDSPLFERGYLIREVAVGDPALVAVEIQYGEFSGRLWRWTEEASWVETTPGAGSDEPSGIEPNDVIWAEGRFVPVRARGEPILNRKPPIGASWSSEDGQTWQESTPVPELEGVRLTTVA